MQILFISVIYCFTLFHLIAAVWEDYGPTYDNPPDTSRSRFVITSSQRRGSQRGRSNLRSNDDYSDDYNSGNSGGRFSARSNNFPDNFRIEIELQRLDNPDGLLETGQHCDVLDSCDPRLSAYLDVSQPFSPFPGAVPVSKWRTIAEARNQNSFTIGKVVTRDICGGSLNSINLRVRIVDVDDTSRDDIVGEFECVYDNLTPDSVAPTLMSAAWSRSTQCRPAGRDQPNSIALTSRMRMYSIPRTSCRSSA